MNLFRQFFCGAQSKQRKTLKENHIDETSAILRTRALEAWGLLLTTCSLDTVYTLVNNKIIEELTVLLMNDLATEFRIVCGQVICLIIELGQLRQSEYFEENMLDTCIVIRNILNDRRSASSTKRKSLNTRLRAVLQYVENGCNPSFNSRFDQEFHQLKSWSSIFKYQKLIRFIGANVAAHYLEHDRIRAIVPISQKPVERYWCPRPDEQYKLDCAATKKSKTRAKRLIRRVPKFSYL